MKIVIKIALYILWATFLVGSVFIFTAANKTYKTRNVRSFTINIDNINANPLVTNNEIQTLLLNNFGDIKKQKIDDINILKIKKTIDKIPFIANSDVRFNIEGDLEININQEKPLFHYITEDNLYKMVSKNGKILPLKPFSPSRTLVATGNIKNIFLDSENIFSIPDSNKILKDQAKPILNCYYLTEIITNDSILNSFVEQIDILENNDINIYTKLGNHIVEFGDTTNTKIKFDKLKTFYNKALPLIGWDKYKVINVKYDKQIVCY